MHHKCLVNHSVTSTLVITVPTYSKRESSLFHSLTLSLPFSTIQTFHVLQNSRIRVALFPAFVHILLSSHWNQTGQPLGIIVSFRSSSAFFFFLYNVICHPNKRFPPIVHFIAHKLLLFAISCTLCCSKKYRLEIRHLFLLHTFKALPSYSSRLKIAQKWRCVNLSTRFRFQGFRVLSFVSSIASSLHPV